MRRWPIVLFVLAVAAACSHGGMVPPATQPNDAAMVAAGKYYPFKHIVIDIQENRSFDNIFAGAASENLIHGVDTVTTFQNVKLHAVPLGGQIDPNHSRAALLAECNPRANASPEPGTSPCQMNGFKQETFFGPTPLPSPPSTYAYAYVSPNDIGPYILLADTYGLADHLYSAAISPSFPGHVFLLSGLGPADDPSNGSYWGCPAYQTYPPSPAPSVELFTAWVSPKPSASPYSGSECFSYTSLVSALQAKKISWRYYVGQSRGAVNGYDLLANPLAAFSDVYGTNGKKKLYTDNVLPRPDFFNAIASSKPGQCNLPAVSWISPNGSASDHAGWGPFPNQGFNDGPYWIATLYEAIAANPACYSSTAFLVVWDDAGGWFDHVPPPYELTQPSAKLAPYRDNVVGLRVPLLFIAPNAAPRVSHVERDFGNIIRFIEKNFGLPVMNGGREDGDFGGDALQDMFSANPKATIAPIPMTQIMLRAKHRYTPAYFNAQPEVPADDQ